MIALSDADFKTKASNDNAVVGDADVEYKTYPGCSRKFFRCQPYEATMSREACAERFRRAQSATADELERVNHCRSCPIGAAHAAVGVVPFYSWLYQSPICPRCGKCTTRMIGDRRCVSCYNRERELKAGKNAKGTKPVNLKPLRRMRIACIVDGAPVVFHTAAVDRVEAMAQISRVTPGRISFCWYGPGFASAPVRALDTRPQPPKSNPGALAA